MPVTHIDGPLVIGTIREGGAGITANVGSSVVVRRGSIAQNSTNAVSVTFVVPANATILDAWFDVTTAFNSGTSATGSIGTAAAGTQYGGSVDMKTAAGRLRPAWTGAQLLAMDNVGANTSVVFTMTPSGATSTGLAKVCLVYSLN